MGLVVDGPACYSCDETSNLLVWIHSRPPEGEADRRRECADRFGVQSGRVPRKISRETVAGAYVDVDVELGLPGHALGGKRVVPCVRCERVELDPMGAAEMTVREMGRPVHEVEHHIAGAAQQGL